MKNTNAVILFLKEIKTTANKAKKNNNFQFQYEDKSIKPLTCDRLISKAMVDLGYLKIV